MSLSFVSSAVQTGTADGGFEETPIETKETEAVNRRNAHKPLFDQLRANQEDDQEKKDELQRQLMRSTCALDEDDVAHLDSIERQRTDRQRQIRERTENELKEFRAARALKQQATVSRDYNDDDDGSDNDVGTEEVVLPMASAIENSAGVQENPAPVATSLPVIKVKKRKRRVDPTNEKSTNTDTNKRGPSKQKVVDSNSEEKDTQGKASSGANETNPTSKKENDQSSGIAKNNTSSGGLGGLLSGYGSSSDEDD